MSNKLKGFLYILVGIIVFALTIIFNNIDNKIAAELYDNYVELSSPLKNDEFNGKLISTTGELTYKYEDVVDDDFSIKVPSAVLIRNVEMFVWTEEETTEEGQTSYTYRKKWSSELIDSNKFRFQERYINPKKMPYESKTIYNYQVKLGDFSLGENELKQLNAKTKFIPNIKNVKLPKGYSISGEYITNSKNIDSPSVGDVRISYTYNTDTNVSVLAKQKDNSFESYKTKDGHNVDIVLSGTYSGNEMIKHFEKDNYVRNNIFVILSLIIVTFGILKTMKKE